MAPTNPTNDSEDDEEFFDAEDDFPFYDCITEQSDQSTSESSKEIPSTLRRRSRSRRQSDSKTSTGERRYKFCRNLKENGINLEKKPEDHRVDSVRHGGGSVSEEKNEQSTVTTMENNDGRVGGSVHSVESPGESSSSQSSSLLVFIAELMIKAIGFQFNLLFSFISFPIWVVSTSFMLIFEPFGTIKRGRDYLLLKIYTFWNLICGFVSPFVNERLKEHQAIWNLVFRMGWGLLWAIYVCFMLSGLMVLSIVMSAFFMRMLVEEPIRIKETLTFDYTENCPVAFVPIMSCDGVLCGVNCKEKKEERGSLAPRAIPVDHKLQVTVMLTLPESDYNKKLGIFQVRVDFLSADGETLSSSRRPSMLKFKSEPIHYLLTFLKAAPLIAGYVSESQILNVKLRGLMERDVPTSCLKVIIEQRAEYRPGAGIPEIYDASLILESQLPLIKRVIWYWKKTIFIWITMMFFMMELFCTLICCSPLILPRPRHRDSSASNIATQSSNLPVENTQSSSVPVEDTQNSNLPVEGTQSSLPVVG